MHKYDPPDIQASLKEAMEEDTASTPKPEALASVKDLELARAKSMGLPVQFEETESPTSVINQTNNEMNELDQWDNVRNDTNCFYSDNEDVSEESDDDLL